MTGQLPPAPWRFDYHGVNDASGERIATLTESMKGRECRMQLGTMLAASHEMFVSLVALIACADPVRDKVELHTARMLVVKIRSGKVGV